MGFDFLENTAIYGLDYTPAGVDMFIPGGVVTVTDRGEVDFIKKTMRAAARFDYDRKESLDFLRFNLLVKYND